MAIVIPDATLSDLLVDTQVHVSAWRVVLFKNNYTPVIGTSWASLTEANFSGYARVTPTFGAPTISASVATSVGSTATFTHNGGATPNDCYGWALIDTTPGTPEVLAADRLTGAPVTLAANGDQIKVTLSQLLKQT